jgi:hypothetical protein
MKSRSGKADHETSRAIPNQALEKNSGAEKQQDNRPEAKAEKQLSDLIGKGRAPVQFSRSESTARQGVVQRQLIFSSEEAQLLPYFVSMFSTRIPFFERVVNDPDIICEIVLDDSEQGEGNLNVLGNTAGRLIINGGVKPSYIIDSGEEGRIKEARANGDLMKASGMRIRIRINKQPLMTLLGREGPPVNAPVPQSPEQMMVTFAHEWELHVVPMVKLFMQIIHNQSASEEEQVNMSPVLDLLETGEGGEHRDLNNLAHFFALIHRVKNMLMDKGEKKPAIDVMMHELQERKNLGLSEGDVKVLIDHLINGEEKKAPPKKKHPAFPFEITGERSVDKEIVNSVGDFIVANNFHPAKKVFVVTGSAWACYIRCVLYHFMSIGKYDEVMGLINTAGNIDVSSGVVVGSAQEEAIRAIITQVTGHAFHVEATDVAHGGMSQSIDTTGQKIQILLTGAHFSLLY